MALLINPYSRTVGHMICYRREGGKTPPHGGMGFTTHCTLERKCIYQYPGGGTSRCCSQRINELVFNPQLAAVFKEITGRKSKGRRRNLQRIKENH